MHVYLNLGFKNQFFHIIVSLSEGYNRVLEKFQKIVIFGQKFENCFSAQIVLHSFCNWMLKTELISELSIMRYMFQTFFLYGIYMAAILSKFWVVYYIIRARSETEMRVSAWKIPPDNKCYNCKHVFINMSYLVFIFLFPCQPTIIAMSVCGLAHKFVSLFYLSVHPCACVPRRT